MESKVCTKCKVLKKLDQYHLVSSKSEKRRPSCKECNSLSMKKNYLENREHRLLKNKIWCENNRDKRRERSRLNYNPEKNKYYTNKWFEKNPNYKKEYREKNKEIIYIRNKKYREGKKEEINKKSRKWYIENKSLKLEKIKEYRKRTNYIKVRKERDPLFRMKTNIRGLIRLSIIKRGYYKKSKSSHILGCTFEFFRQYIESQFESWMSWENYGLYNGTINHGWDLDHIIPVSSSLTEEDVIRLNHYTNLQPLCSYINRNVKRDRIEF